MVSARCSGYGRDLRTCVPPTGKSTAFCSRAGRGLNNCRTTRRPTTRRPTRKPAPAPDQFLNDYGSYPGSVPQSWESGYGGSGYGPPGSVGGWQFVGGSQFDDSTLGSGSFHSQFGYNGPRPGPPPGSANRYEIPTPVQMTPGPGRVVDFGSLPGSLPSAMAGSIGTIPTNYASAMQGSNMSGFYSAMQPPSTVYGGVTTASDPYPNLNYGPPVQVPTYTNGLPNGAYQLRVDGGSAVGQPFVSYEGQPYGPPPDPCANACARPTRTIKQNPKYFGPEWIN